MIIKNAVFWREYAFYPTGLEDNNNDIVYADTMISERMGVKTLLETMCTDKTVADTLEEITTDYISRFTEEKPMSYEGSWHADCDCCSYFYIETEIGGYPYVVVLYDDSDEYLRSILQTEKFRLSRICSLCYNGFRQNFRDVLSALEETVRKEKQRDYIAR